MELEDPNKQSGHLVVDLTEASSQLPAIELSVIRHGSHSTRPAPAFILGPCPADSLRHYHNDQFEPPVLVYKAKGFEVIGPWFITGVLLARENIAFACPGISSSPDRPESQAKLAEHRRLIAAGKKSFRYVPGQVLLLAANGHQIYGHWLMDFLPKLYSLERVGIKLDRVKVLLPENMGSFGRQFLLMLGIKEENMIIYDPDREAIMPEELIIPTTLRWGGRCSPLFSDAVAYIGERIDYNNRVPVMDQSRRIFISRSKSGRTARPLVNEDTVEAIATEARFTVVYPEELTLLDQVALFRGARRIIGQNGSALHGTIFSRAGVIVASLHGQLPATFDALQSGLAERLGQPTGYVLGSSVSGQEDTMAQLVPEDLVQECLREHMSI